MWRLVRRFRPHRCIEIGTWKGGGSTLFVTQALHDNGVGLLHTVEIDATVHRQAKAAYERHLPDLLPFVRFELGDYRQVLSDRLADGDGVDLLFLDGAEDAEQTRKQLDFLTPLFARARCCSSTTGLATRRPRCVRSSWETMTGWFARSSSHPSRSAWPSWSIADRREWRNMDALHCRQERRSRRGVIRNGKQSVSRRVRARCTSEFARFAPRGPTLLRSARVPALVLARIEIAVSIKPF